jgi:predicted RNase H-like nuclease (RuvC/YqgF family)
MAEITILDLVNNLIDKTYDTGWTAGAIEQGRNDLRDIQQAGISKRGVAKEWLLREVAELESLRAEVEKWRKNAEDMQRDWASPIEVTAHKHTIDALTQSVNNNASRIVDLRAEVAELKEGIQDVLDMAWELVPSRSAPVLKDTRAGIINKLSALLK